MIARCVVLIALAGCSDDREHDCKVVRRMLSPDPAVGLHDPQLLTSATWRDASVRAAIAELTTTDWTYYTPYSDGRAKTEQKLRGLCGIR